MAEKSFQLLCPIPISEYPNVLLAHGGGGKLMAQLISKLFAETLYKDKETAALHDGAELTIKGERVAFTTDSFVVNPLFFPGGNIGELAVYGTVNDLAMCGARPKALSLGFILEEGLKMETLWKIVRAIREAADRVGIEIVTGDTKVVERGKGDGIFINSSGIGEMHENANIHPRRVVEGDAIILSGDIGRHGMAILAQREGMNLDTPIQSDAAPLHEPVLALLDAGIDVHCLRDATRGGVASVLHEISLASKSEIRVDEGSIDVTSEVKGVCEILGLDPLYVANEGRFLSFVSEKDAEKALAVLQSLEVSKGSKCIGRVGKAIDQAHSRVYLKGLLGVSRALPQISGEQLPRIC